LRFAANAVRWRREDAGFSRREIPRAATAGEFAPLASGGFRVEAHCCDEMRRQVERVCEQHPDRFDCPDCLIYYSPRFNEYGLIVHDGGSAYSRIRVCPWCGTRLPESLRDERDR